MSGQVRTAFAIVALLSAGAGAAQAGAPLPHPSQGRCPKLHAQRLPSSGPAAAKKAALEQARVVYRGTNLNGMRATRAVRAANDRERGGYARVKCGRLMQERTVVVYLEFPAMRPSASLSQGVVLVSRFAGKYRVWAQLH
jgi:hypothetical protein